MLLIFILLAAASQWLALLSAETSQDTKGDPMAKLEDLLQESGNILKELRRKNTTDFAEHFYSFESRLNTDIHEIKSDLTNLKNGLDQCGYKAPGTAEDCSALYKAGQTVSGVYSIRPPGSSEPVQVRCDMDTNGGGWTVFQKRGDYGNPEDFFYKGWDEYKTGFGNAKLEYWLGNEIISAMTNKRKQEMRVDLWDMNNTHAYAAYKSFWIEGEDRHYRLNVDKYSGDAGDSMNPEDKQGFTTKDRDNDSWNGNCAQSCHGAWWYSGCGSGNLNGLNLKGPNDQYWSGIMWYTWKGLLYSLSKTEMKIRPVDFLS